MKRTTDTSREALAYVTRTLPTREADVLDALSRMTARHGMPPTAYELLKFMQCTNPLLDLNGVRPRLTSLKDAGRVHCGDKRLCDVTGVRAYTWTVAPTPDPPRATEWPTVQETFL